MTAARWVGRSRRRIVVAAVAVAASAAALVAVPGVPRTLFPPNLAAGKTWKASSGIDGWPTRGVLSDEAWPMLFFHTREEASPWVVVDLGSAQRLHEVDVTNRIDCCRDRAQPLEVEVSEDESSWRRVAYRRLEFREWDASFSPTRARFVRLRVPRQSLLHLARIAVY